MQTRSVAKNIRVSPRKTRLIVDAIRGMMVEDALATLRFMRSPTARLVAKAVRSAAANAENNFFMSPDRLYIVEAYVDGARMLKRFRPRARGRVSPILKRGCHITIVVEEG